MAYAHVREMTVEHDGELHVKGLPIRAGDRIDVVVIQRRDSKSAQDRYPLHGQPLEYTDPFEPAVDPQEWEANR